MNGGASWAAVHGIAKSRTQLSDSVYTYTLRLSISSRGNVTNVVIPGISLLSKSSNLLAGNAVILFVKMGAEVPVSIDFSVSPSNSARLYFLYSGDLF